MTGRRNASSASAARSPVATVVAGAAGRAARRGRPLTTPSGDAVRSSDTTRPAQRHEAHSARSRISAGGPQPLTLASGWTTTPAGGSTGSATTQPPTLRPCSTIRTMVPTRTSSAMPDGTR